MLQHKFHQVRPHHHWHCLFCEYFFSIFNWYNKHYPPTQTRAVSTTQLSQETHFVSGISLFVIFFVTEHFWMVKRTHTRNMDTWARGHKFKKRTLRVRSSWLLAFSCSLALPPLAKKHFVSFFTHTRTACDQNRILEYISGISLLLRFFKTRLENEM